MPVAPLHPGISPPLIFNGFEKIEWQPINIWSYGAINWERDADLKEYITTVNEVKSRHEALQTGSYRYLETSQGLTDDTQVMSFLREAEDDVMIVVVNMDVFNQAGPVEIYLPEDFDTAYVLVDELTGKTYERAESKLTVILEPGQSHLFSVRWNE